MDRYAAPRRPRLVWIRSAFTILAIAPVVLLAIRLLLGSAPPPPGLAEDLSGRQAPTVLRRLYSEFMPRDASEPVAVRVVA